MRDEERYHAGENGTWKAVRSGQTWAEGFPGRFRTHPLRRIALAAADPTEVYGMRRRRGGGMLTKLTALIALLLLPGIHSSSAVIYKNAGCGHCDMYLNELMPMLQREGYTNVAVKDFISNTTARDEVEAIQERFGVPLSMQGHLLVLIDDKYLFEGHVPTSLMEAYLKDPKGSIVVTQDKMDGATSYTMLMDGKQHTCPIGQPFAECASGDASAQDAPSSLLYYLPFGLLAAAAGFVFFYVKGK